MLRALRVAALAWAGLLVACQPAGEKEGDAGAGSEATRVNSTDDFVTRIGTPIDPDTHPGKALFYENCAGCHSGAVPKAPAIVWLEMLEPDMVLDALNNGIMKQQAAHLSPTQRQEIAEYLARVELDDYQPPAPPPTCTGDAARFAGPPPAAVGWGHDTGRFVPAENGGLNAADLKGLKLKWAFAYPGANRARSQPTIGWNTIFVGSQSGKVYAFDLATGCAKWTFRASAEVRNAIVADAKSKRLYFGDILGRVYALDAMTGKQVWQVKADDHPNATITGTPALGGGVLAVPISSLEVTSAADPKYDCCSFRGAVLALDPATGKRLWKTYTVPAEPREQGRTSVGAKILGPSGAPVWGSPAYDAKRDRFYFGSGENYSSPADENSDALFAIDARTGRKLWQVQFTKNDAWNVGCMIGNENCPKENGPDLDLAASPILVPIGDGKDIVVVGQKSGVAYGVDPDTGKIVWDRRLGHGGTQGGVHFGMAREGVSIYVPIVDMVDTYDDRTYDAKLNGAGIHAIEAATGKVIWRNKAKDNCGGRPYCDPGVSAAATAIPGAVLAGHLDGMLRGYDRKTGKILWSYDTTKPVKTITGVTARGGGMSGPGPAAYNGHLVVNSGYGLYFHMPGNVLLVFEKSR
ncbi:PQQ-binding-like beta-propeller repeat protein [Altererythrobacter sp. GH1-8]|uniref:outer membrane protein assembly factor BamB family protein n=1 Tax=Altererythrobacter sp. GH1-8 TaxID=3349333 RepID=UPI00374DF3E4